MVGQGILRQGTNRRLGYLDMPHNANDKPRNNLVRKAPFQLARKDAQRKLDYHRLQEHKTQLRLQKELNPRQLWNAMHLEMS